MSGKKSSGSWIRDGEYLESLDALAEGVTKIVSLPFQALWEGIKSSAMSGGGVPTTYATTGQHVYRVPQSQRKEMSLKLDEIAAPVFSVLSPNLLLGSIRYQTTPWNQNNLGITHIEGYPGISSLFGLGLDALTYIKAPKLIKPTNIINKVSNPTIGNWSLRLPRGEGVYLRQGNKGIIDDAINTGVVGPESVRSNSTRVIEHWKADSKVPGDKYDLAYLKGIQWMAEHPNATDNEILDFVLQNTPGFNFIKHFSRNYMFNEGTPFYGDHSKYPYTILGINRPEIQWRPVKHKGHLHIREPYVQGAENQMGVPTEYMEGYYTELPFKLGYWFRKFPETHAPALYYPSVNPGQINIPYSFDGTYTPYSRR